jgi:hypothetical protein
MAILLLGGTAEFISAHGYLLVHAGAVVASRQASAPNIDLRRGRLFTACFEMAAYAARTLARKPSSALRNIPD